jgi:hypothetical protein
VVGYSRKEFKMAKPITPSEVTRKKKESLPKEVIEAFNELIAEKWDGSSATVMQPEVIKLICSKLNVRSDKVFDSGWLDVESIFRQAGWSVKYDKPGYNESYEASFEFRKKRSRQRDEEDF